VRFGGKEYQVMFRLGVGWFDEFTPETSVWMIDNVHFTLVKRRKLIGICDSEVS
jgi:hypothetical protein